MRKLAILLLPMPVVEWLVRIKTAILFNKFTIERIHNNYQKTIKRLQKKIQKGEKIRVCFAVIFDSMFQTAPVFEAMLQDEMFDPFILVIPNTNRGEKNMTYQMDKTYKTLSKKYSQVYLANSNSAKKFIDWSPRIDIMFFNNIYDDATEPLYSIAHYARKGMLTCYTGYGYIISNWYKNLLRHNTFFKTRNILLWKIFALEKHEQTLLRQICHSNQIVLTGYSKMDQLGKMRKVIRERKKIIIAPHHTVTDWDLTLSNFFRYSDFFLELPKKYPNIDFVFRPHPLLFVKLVAENLWTKQKITKYLDELSAMNNVEYQNGGDYFDTFVNSDAIIHDCGSFSAEYLFTGHPCCYMLHNAEITHKNSNSFHQQCVQNHYPAYNEQDIINFIEQVVLAGKDSMKEKRNRFFEEKLKYNYPHTSEKILQYIKRAITMPTLLPKDKRI